jgi:hypothetical protein
MSISITDVSYRIIWDAQKNELFKFHTGTMLDRIIPDLWNDITRYMNYSFAIGLSSKDYPEYRKITIIEFNECQDKIFDNYFANHGIENACGHDKYLYTGLVIENQVLIDVDGYGIYSNIYHYTTFVILNRRQNPVARNDKFKIWPTKNEDERLMTTIMVPKIGNKIDF